MLALHVADEVLLSSTLVVTQHTLVLLLACIMTGVIFLSRWCDA